MRLGSLFSGYLGLDMAVERHFGAETVWTSDVDPGACKIIAHRTSAPNLGDITTIDWAAVEPVDILTGGFPCQDLSHAGKRAGLKPGTRSGLWSHMAYAISQLRPRYVVAENVRGLLSARAHSDLEPCPWCVGGAADGEPDLRALGAVLGDLAELGYDAQWTGIRAADIGAPHGRFRVFVVATDAHSSSVRTRRASAVWGSWTRGGAARFATHPASNGRHQGWAESAGIVGGHDAALSGDAPADATCERHGDGGPQGVRGLPTPTLPGDSWGPYAPAIRRWERRLGRPAPAPTETSPKGSQRLSPRFVEWMMGLPAGWVCDVPGLSRNEQLKALGNGVVPQQAYAALELMLDEAVAA